MRRLNLSSQRGSAGFWTLGAGGMITLTLLFLSSLEMVRLVLVRQSLEQSLMTAVRAAAREFSFTGSVRDSREPLALDPDRAAAAFGQTLAANLGLPAPPTLSSSGTSSLQFDLPPGGILPEGGHGTLAWGSPVPTAVAATLTAPVELPVFRVRTVVRVSARAWIHVADPAVR